MIWDDIAKRRRLEARNLRNSYSYFNFHSLYNTLQTKRVVVSGPKSFRDVGETGGRFSKDPVTYRARKVTLKTMIRENLLF